MSVLSGLTAAAGLVAFAGAGVLGPDRIGPGGGPGPTFGTRRPTLPPPERRVPPLEWVRSRLGRVGMAGERGRDRLATARWATPADLRPLLQPRGARGDGPDPGRVPLGSVGRHLVCAERAQSVLVFGPSQSRKTSGLAVPAILDWAGPVVAASVKSDLLEHTIGHRAALGTVSVFDPSGSTGRPSVTWSPLERARTWPGARRAASSLVEAAKASVGTMSDGDFWYATAAKMLAPLLFAAATGRQSMAEVIRWVETGEEGEVLDLLDVAGVREAGDAARSAFAKEDRQRSSIATTAETVLEPFAVTGPFADGGDDAPVLDVAHLVDGAHTLYLCAPAHEQRRLTPLFTSVVHEVVEHVYDRVTRTGRPLDPPLLVVLDEAANIAPLADLDALAATAAGHGVQLVTVWHDLAQITARYGARATTVVNNHRAKLFLSGISDPSTLDYASQLVGDHELYLPSVTSGGRGAPSTTRAPSMRRLAPPDALRRISPGEGVLVYRDLPPARLRLRPWFEDPVLRERVTRRSPSSGGRPDPG